VGVVIPPDFHEQRARGKNASILTLVDGSDATSTGQALAAMNGLVAQMNVDAQQEDVASSERGMAFAARALILFNPLGRTANFMLPGMMVIVMQVFIQMSANSLVIEQEMGTMERLLMTPVDFTGMMLGKMAPYWVISMIDIVLLLLAMRWGFGIPIRGSVPLLLGAYGLFMINMLAWGLLFAATAVHPTQVGQRAMLFSIPALFLTGYIFPLSGLPWWLLPISYAHPITHQMEIVRGIILRGSSFSDLLRTSST
jgi:ABC-2 type transport system permease protein